MDKESLDLFLRTQANLFRRAGASDESLRLATLQYIKSGLVLGLSQGELIDYLGVSSPSVLEAAGLNEVLQQKAMQLLGTIADHELGF